MAKKTVPVETTEEKYERAGRLEHSIECLTRDKERADIYLKISKIYAELGAYEDSKERSEACAKKAEEYRKKYRQQEEQEISRKKEEEQEQKQGGGKVRKAVLVLIVVFLVVAAAFVVFLKTKAGRYARADFYEGQENYKKSYLMFKNLKDYKDSADRSRECYYEYAGQCAKQKDYIAAKDAYRALEDYKDSEEQLTAVEIANIKKQDVGAEVLYGECRWLILEKEQDRVFLLKSVPVNGIAYNENVKGRTTTWENSSLRKCLNSAFIEETFNKPAQSRIETTTVRVLSKEKTSATEDRLFLLNAKQAQQYQEIHQNYLRDWWLIDAGVHKNTAQFVSYGVLMPYGYDVTDTNINIRPAMWISIK